MAVKIAAVELGLVYEHLDPEKTYVLTQVNPMLEKLTEAAPDVKAVNVPGVGWTRKTLFGKDGDYEFDKSPNLEARGFAADRTDVYTQWVLVGENATATLELTEYGSTEVLSKILVDSTGLIIDITET